MSIIKLPRVIDKTSTTAVQARMITIVDEIFKLRVKAPSDGTTFQERYAEMVANRLTEEEIDITHLNLEWIKIRQINSQVYACNLYTFAAMCGEVVEPWKWVPGKIYHGKLGLYEDRGDIFTLKVRKSRKSFKAVLPKFKPL